MTRSGGPNRVSAVTLFIIADKLAGPLRYFYEDFAADQQSADTAMLNNPRHAFAASTEGEKLIDAYRACSPAVRRAALSLLQIAGTSAHEAEPDSKRLSMALQYNLSDFVYVQSPVKRVIATLLYCSLAVYACIKDIICCYVVAMKRSCPVEWCSWIS
jgi:hypothetical protein